jgi:lactase-phlorizin hydrolase
VLRWAQGYTERFGLHAVNMSSPERLVEKVGLLSVNRRTRTAKQSAAYYGALARANGFPEGDLPCTIG